MPDAAIPANLPRDLTIHDIKTTITDVPAVRKHKLSSLSVTAQSYVIVGLRLANGVTGIGEAATLGGPLWSEEGVESIKATIDTSLTPALLNAPANRFVAARTHMDAAVKCDDAAKGAIERALFNAVGKTLGIPAVQLLCGHVRDSYCGPSLPVIPRRKSRRRNTNLLPGCSTSSRSRSAPRRLRPT